jgi:molecular chaperone GrpE
MTEQKEKPKKRKIDQIYQQKIAELTELVQRTQASFENYRKQSDKRVEELRKMAARGIVEELLPVIDNFDLAIKNVDVEHPTQFVDGIKLIHAQLNSVLLDNGVEPILALGELFDPHKHEALMKVASDKKENVIIEEFQHGFMMHGQVIRTARVKVSAGNGVSTKNTTNVK